MFDQLKKMIAMECETTLAVPALVLTAADRCDRCCAQAQVMFVRASASLLFCAHHANTFEVGLLIVGFESVVDNSGDLR